jgi:hypothetical protein
MDKYKLLCEPCHCKHTTYQGRASYKNRICQFQTEEELKEGESDDEE